MSIAYRKNGSLAILVRLGLVVALLVTALSALLLQRPMSAAGAYRTNADTAPPGGPLLRLHRGTLDIRTARRLAPTSSLAAPAPGPYAIVQLYGPITLADRQALERTGIKLLE